MENVMIWGRFWVHHEADKNSMNSCQLIPTHYLTKSREILSSFQFSIQKYGSVANVGHSGVAKNEDGQIWTKVNMVIWV